MYRNLPGRLIAGEVIFADTKECAKGVTVTLKCDKGELTATTDFFGDFEFKGLEANKCFKITVELDGYKTQTIDVKTATDKNIGEVLLSK